MFVKCAVVEISMHTECVCVWGGGCGVRGVGEGLTYVHVYTSIINVHPGVVQF